MIFCPRKALYHWRNGILLAVLAMVLLTACQSDPTLPTVVIEPTPGVTTPEPEVILLPTATPTIAPTPTLPEHLTVTASELDGQKIQVWHPFHGEVSEQFDEALREFNRSNEWGIRAEVRQFYSTGELFEAVGAGLENPENGLPDVLIAAPDQLAYWAVEKDTLVDLNEYIQHEPYGLSEEDWQASNPAFTEQDQLENSGPVQLGLPALRSAHVLFYNVTWAKELGFSQPPQTPDQFKQQACAAAVANNTSKLLDKFGTGGWIIDTSVGTTMSWLTAFGADPIPAQEGQPYRFASNESQAAFAFLRDLQDDGCAWLSRMATPYENFARRKALFYSAGLTEMDLQVGWQALTNSKDEWIILPYPGQDGKPVLYVSGYSYALIKQEDAQAQTAAWLFTRWMVQPDRSVELASALPSIPVSSKDVQQLSDSQSDYPWKLILPLTDAARPMPSLSTWREVHRLVEDASWQIYHLPVDALPQILPQLDEAVEELVSPSR